MTAIEKINERKNEYRERLRVIVMNGMKPIKNNETMCMQRLKCSVVCKSLTLYVLQCHQWFCYLDDDDDDDDDCFYIALFSALEQTHCARM